MLEFKPGMVASIFRARSRTGSREEWEQGVAGVWDEAVEELKSNPGFHGLVTWWNNDDSGDVIIMGIWENLEDRLNYEARSGPKVQGLFNALLEEVPQRPRYVVTRGYTQP